MNDDDKLIKDVLADVMTAMEAVRDPDGSMNSRRSQQLLEEAAARYGWDLVGGVLLGTASGLLDKWAKAIHRTRRDVFANYTLLELEDPEP